MVLAASLKMGLGSTKAPANTAVDTNHGHQAEEAKIPEGTDDKELTQPENHSNGPDTILALILNVDIYQTIRLYQVTKQLTELVFEVNICELLRSGLASAVNGTNINEDESMVEVSSIELSLPERMVLVTTLDNQILLLTPKFEVRRIKLVMPEYSLARVTVSLLFEHLSTSYLCLGFSTGKFIAEELETVVQNGEIR